MHCTKRIRKIIDYFYLKHEISVVYALVVLACPLDVQYTQVLVMRRVHGRCYLFATLELHHVLRLYYKHYVESLRQNATLLLVAYRSANLFLVENIRRTHLVVLFSLLNDFIGDVVLFLLT